VSDQEHSEDLTDLTNEIKRLHTTNKIACSNLADVIEQRNELIEQCRKRTEALNTSMLLINQLILELGFAERRPSPALEAAKKNFDAVMEKLLGLERTSVPWRPGAPGKSPSP
jgi:hypothetical protein